MLNNLEEGKFPFHPVGFVFGTWYVRDFWGSLLLGWAAKLLLLRYGGLRLYRRSMPFFLGLMVGHLIMVLFWAVVACISGEFAAGYALPTYPRAGM